MREFSTTKKPVLRFAPFVKGWEVKKLSEIFERVTKKNTVGNKNVLTISSRQGLVKQETFFTKSVSSSDLSNYTLLKRDDFAYNKSYSANYPMGAIKRLYRYENGVVSPLYITMRLRDQELNVVDFFDFLFDGGYLNREITKIAQEGARNHGLLNMSITDFFNNVNFHLPSYDEQVKIVTFLNTINEWIENLCTQKNKLEEYKMGMMQKLFSQEIRFKDKNNKDFPIWEKVKLGKVFVERTERAGNKKYALLSVTLGKGVIKYDHSTKKDSSSDIKTNYKVVRIGDIAYNTMRMWQGSSGVSNYEGIVSPAYTVVTPKKGDSEFFGYLFKAPRTIFDFYRYSQGLTSDTWNIKFSHFSEVEVSIPSSVEEQTRIKEFLVSVDKVITFKAKQIKEAEAWKKGLLQKMFV
jgi:type I restriction enzyme, S subunit